MNTTRHKVVWLLRRFNLTAFQLAQCCSVSVSRMRQVLSDLGAPIVSTQKGTNGRPWNVYTLR